MLLPQTFYARDTTAVARELLGCYLVHFEDEQTTMGRIVETEAYVTGDPASHAFRGKTKRTGIMFGPPGYAYVYLIYGLHTCLNVVTREEGVGEAVLFRALEPVLGLTAMQARRRTEKAVLLCSGPARLTQALAVSLSLSGCPLFEGCFQIWSADTFLEVPSVDAIDVVQTTRIGIAKATDLPLRFYLKGNPYVSKP